MPLRSATLIALPAGSVVAGAVRSIAIDEGACFRTFARVSEVGSVLAAPSAPGEAPRVAVVVDVASAHGVTTSALAAIARHAALVLVGADGVARLARRVGADDFVFADEVTSFALERAISAAFERRGIGDNRDPLTGAVFGPAFRASFGQRIERARQRPQGSVGIIVVNLDRFDAINESFGYDAGDAVLQDAVKRLTKVASPGDVGHIHADTMAVAFDESTPRDQLVQQIRDALERPYMIDRQEVQLTASMGVAEFPGDADDSDTLLRVATRAMHRAKHVGRNTVQIVTRSLAPASPTEKSRARFALERDLRRAVDHGELLLHYQPQLDIATGRVLGVEALVRWNRPNVGMVSPADFVPLLEDTGLIVPASDWILHTACRQIREWMAAGIPPLRVAVNVSATHIRQGKLLPSVERALDRTGLAADLLELELTEGLLIENTKASGVTLDSLRALGASISLDDFGTGYSSLNYLKRLPIDVVKIDRSFLQEVPAKRTDSAITSAIITLAHELGHRVVAEGVETKEQLGFLAQHGCDAAQGFYLSRPLPADRCFDWLRERSDEFSGASGTFPQAGTLAACRPNVIKAAAG